MSRSTPGGAAATAFHPGLYAAFTVTAAGVAAAAAGASLALGLPPWAMFVGWIAYFTRRPVPAEGLQTYACTVTGLVLGAACALATGALAPVLGVLALPLVVFLNALVVIATRGLPVLNNLLGYFLGLVAFFAAHLPPEPSTLATLAGAIGLGSIAAWTAVAIEAGVRRRAAS